MIAVALGGAAGSLLRYGFQKTWNTHFPYGTLGANLLGCLLIGLFWGWLWQDAKETTRLFLMTGLCGGFTTFSAFSQESLALLMSQRWPAFILYTIASVVGGILATYTGFKLTT